MSNRNSNLVNDVNEEIRSGLIGRYESNRDFFKEVNYIMKVHDVPYHRVGILNETVDSSIWIMIDDKWAGDLDDWFYECMDKNAPSEEYFYGLQSRLN